MKLTPKECPYCKGAGTYREHPSDTGYACPDCQGEGQWFQDENGKCYSFDDGMELLYKDQLEKAGTKHDK